MTDTADGYRIRSDDAWSAARSDYLAGFTAPEVCARHDVGLSALRRRARVEGWRRADQDDPEILVEDLETLPDAGLAELVRQAWKRFALAIVAGRAADAVRWQRIHAALHALAQAEAEADHRDAFAAAQQAQTPPDRRGAPWPRLRPSGENVHDVHPEFADGDDGADLPRAERRRRLREARRRS